MLRIIGILTGAALAIAFLVVALGVPEFARSGPVTATPATAPPPLPDSEENADTEPSAEPESSAAAIPDPESAPEPETAPEPEPVAAEPAVGPVEENWYAFWSPFRSEIAASGFVARLQETTGMDYRVVKVKTGVYEVAFAYTDDADIDDKLARISSATGLDMSGG